MRIDRSPALRLCFLVALIAAALAGCGGDDDAPAPGQTPQTPEAPEALTGEEAAAALAEGADLVNGSDESVTGSLELELSGGPTLQQSLRADVAFDPAADTGRFAVEAGGSDLTVVLDGDDAYLTSSSPEFGEALPDGADYILADVDDLEGVGIDTFLGGEEGISPQLYLVLGAKDVESVGTEQIGGDEVQVYEFMIDEDEAVAEAPDELKSAVDDAVRLEGANATLAGRASLDSEGRIRRFELNGSADAPSGSPLGDVTFELGLVTTLETFGEEIEVSAPEGEPVSLAEGAEALARVTGLLDG